VASHEKVSTPLLLQRTKETFTFICLFLSKRGEPFRCASSPSSHEYRRVFSSCVYLLACSPVLLSGRNPRTICVAACYFARLASRFACLASRCAFARSAFMVSHSSRLAACATLNIPTVCKWCALRSHSLKRFLLFFVLQVFTSLRGRPSKLWPVSFMCIAFFICAFFTLQTW
jgi:hypothetical protein